MRILLAEDNPIARTAIAAGLSGDGYEVDLAGDGQEALQQARRHAPDLIISDILMPRMDGYSLCREVRNDERLQHVPVVFYSATFLDPQDEELARSVGASGFIHKDSDPAAFQRQLQRIIDRGARGMTLESSQTHPDPEALTRQHQRALTDKLTEKVHELERERQALRENQQLLQQIVTTVPDVVFVLQLPGLEPRYVAPKAERLIGFSGDAVMGDASLWLALVEEGDRSRVIADIQKAVETRSSVVTLARMRHKEGGYRWIEGHLSPRLDEQGEPVELVGALNDVTERINVQEQLRERERSLETLFSNLPGMAYRCENTPDWKMAFVSDGAEEISGYQPEELTGESALPYGELILPEERQRVWEEVQLALEQQRQFSISYPIRHKDGSVRWVWERGVSVPADDGGEVWIEGFINDITLRKQAEDELVALNRVLHTLSEGNRVLVRAGDEQALLESIIGVFTHQGGYPVAWVVLPGEDGRSLRCCYARGEMLQALSPWCRERLQLDDRNHPVVRAFRTGDSVIIGRDREDDSDGVADYQRLLQELQLETFYLLPICYRDKVFGVLGIVSRLPAGVQSKELPLLEELASDVGYGIQSHRNEQARMEGLEHLHTAMLRTVEAVSLALEKRDPYTAGHQNRVAQLAVAIARRMGMEEQRIEGLHLGSMVHDIGKISVPAEILNRPGRLTEDEFGVIKAHPQTGYDILKGVDFPWPIAEMIIQHHERLDGSGYPHGLKGEAMIEEARILAVADVVEAITSHRPYRASLGSEVALQELERGRGTIYDARVVDSCLALFREEGFDWE